MAYTDGDFTTPTQDGAKKISFPLQAQGDYYATLTKRPYVAMATAYDPIIEQRNSFTNLLTYSDDMANAAWTQQLTTTTAASTDPEGGVTASKIVETTSSGDHEIFQGFTASGSVQAGVFLKAAERSFVKLRLGASTTAVFNLTTGEVTGVAGSASCKRLLNGWFWCSISGAQNAFFEILIGTSASTFNYLGAAGNGVYAWRATVVSSATTPFPAIATTATTRGVTVPPVDPDDPISVLVEETEPDESDLKLGVARWARYYARVPTTLNVQTSTALQRPKVPGTAYNSYAQNVAGTAATTGILSTYEMSSTYVADYSSQSTFEVFGPLKTITGSLGRVFGIGGGTFTVTYKGVTTAAQAYNVSNANLATAINGLSTVIADGLTVTATNNIGGSFYFDVSISVGSTTSLFTADGSSLTAAGSTSKTFINKFNSATSQRVEIGIEYSIASHGFSSSSAIVVRGTAGGAATYCTIQSGSWASNDANTIAFLALSSLTAAAQFIRSYNPGPKSVRATNRTNFYLPGYTPGVDAATSIPIPTLNYADVDLLTAIFQDAGEFAYAIDDLAFYQGPIYKLGVKYLNPDDV